MIRIVEDDRDNQRVFVEVTGTDYDGIYCSYGNGEVYKENGSSLDIACDIAVITVNEFLSR